MLFRGSSVYETVCLVRCCCRLPCAHLAAPLCGLTLCPAACPGVPAAVGRLAKGYQLL